MVAPCIPRTTLRHYFRVQGACWVLLPSFVGSSGLWGSIWRGHDGGCDMETTGGRPIPRCHRCHILVRLQAVPLVQARQYFQSPPAPAPLNILFVPWSASWGPKCQRCHIPVGLQAFSLVQTRHHCQHPTCTHPT